MLNVANLSKRFADKLLFSHVNLRFVPGNCYGVIGANGVGKSTFLKIIAGEMEPSEGEVFLEKNRRISMLRQDQFQFDEHTALETVLMGHRELYSIMKERERLYAADEYTDAIGERLGELESKFAELNGWDAEAQALKLLADLGISQDHANQLMKTLRANDKVKVLLAQALFGEPDILILDEPTNHLDMTAISWLEQFLSNYPNVVIVVSHDTDFLNNVANVTIDIDFQEAKVYPGNYDFWKESSSLALQMAEAANEKKEEQRQKLKDFIARFSANASKAKQATSRRKNLEAISLDDIKPSSRKYPFISFPLSREQGNDVLEVSNLSYTTQAGVTLLKDVSFTLNAHDKLVVLGDNDLAKTKLIEILAGLDKQTSGTIKWGVTVAKELFPIDNASYFTDPAMANLSIHEWTMLWTKDTTDSNIKGMLGRMLFGGESIKKKVSACSGGEKSRLMFARMMFRPANFILLDQPLEHLDTESVESVIEALAKYQGGVIVTTYNKTLARKVANRVLELGVGGSFFYEGGMEEYLADAKAQAAVAKIHE